MRHVLLLVLFSGCAQLHHYQIGEIDNTLKPGEHAARFEVMESATGFNAEEARDMLQFLTHSSKVDKVSNTGSDIFNGITYGPRTGEVVFNDTYPDMLPRKVREACSKGRVTGLSIGRETNKYPIVSGEIVRITGTCITTSKETP